MSNKHFLKAKKLWGSIALTLLMSIATVSPVFAVCPAGQQSCSSSYSVGEAFFGNGGNLDQSSASYRAKTALGETTVGNSDVNYAGVIAADSPIAYWRLGETSGTTAVDSSGNGRNGTYSGTYTLGKSSLTNDETNRATLFNGGTTDHVSVASNAAWSVTTTNHLAVDFWYSGTQVGVGSGAGRTGLISANTDSSNKSWSIGIDNNGRVVATAVQGGGSYIDVVGTTVVNNGIPHYIAVNYDQSTTTISLYVDGTLDNSGSILSFTTFGSPSLQIANNPRNNAAAGTYDEVAIYNSNLTPTQISKHYATGNYQLSTGFNSNRNEYLQAQVNTTSIDFGTLTNSSTHVGTASFNVKAYLANGYQVISSSTPPKNGSYTMSAPTTPTASTVGTEQFGMNVVANTCPGTAPGSGPGSCTSTLGSNAVQVPSDSYSYGLPGDGTGNTPSTARYDQPNKYMYRNGDVIAYSSKSTGETDYTISYIMNISSVTPGGTYSMVQSLVATGTF